MNERSNFNHIFEANNIAGDMNENEYDILSDLILAECDMPGNLFPPAGTEEKNCYFLFEYELCRFLFIDSRYESFTGYPPKEHEQGGLDFWFPKVHPEDRKMLGERIIESLKINKNFSSKTQPKPQTLNYRFKKGTGEWIWMQHTVYNISYDRVGKVNKVLHKLRLLNILKQFAGETNHINTFSLKGNNNLHNLTGRETEVLKLIAEGFSSKMIAGILKISINTVEAHRRHLLEKLAAKNSMELIKKAFMLFWN